jgi:hypothetical protein
VHVRTSVSDPYLVNPDPDLSTMLNPDPDPGTLLNPDPDQAVPEYHTDPIRDLL